MAFAQDTRRPVSRPGLPQPCLNFHQLLSLGKFHPRSCIRPPGGHCLSDHLSVTVVSPPELPQTKLWALMPSQGENRNVLSRFWRPDVRLWVSAGPLPEALEGLSSLAAWCFAAVPWLTGACLQPTGFIVEDDVSPCSHCPPTACVLITVFVKYS